MTVRMTLKRLLRLFNARNPKQAWLVGMAVVLVSMVSSSLLSFLLFPLEMAVTLRYKVPTIAFLIATPLSVIFSRILLLNYQLNSRLRHMVERDMLTDVSTRESFFTRLGAQPDAVGVMLMVDIDHFKSVNDTHGHLAGDTVIRSVAARLKEECRDTDLVCRFGGEEFVIFLRGAGAEKGLAVAERMRRGVEQSLPEVNGAPLRVTVSIGGAIKEVPDRIDRAIQRADAALYRAKAMGRNRIETAWQRPETELRLAAGAGMTG